MNNTTKAGSGDEKVWEHHRSKIESLYWKHSRSAIDAHMKEHHGFVASKSQYERHFRIWGLRKNLTGPEWAIFIRYVKRNSIRLEEVEVLFKGHEIPQKRILQEIARRSSLNSILQDGPHKLPKEITVRPRSRAPNMDAANGLQTIPALAASSSSSSMQTEAGFELVTITSPSINRHSLNIPTLVAGYSTPFSWMRLVDMNSFSQSLSASQQLTKWKQPSKTQLDALLYSNRQSFLGTPHGSHGMLLPSYAIASLVNNVSSVSYTTSNDAYALLKVLPLNVLSRGLKALPASILDALKERVFATAVKAGDVDLVSTMLKLNVDPRERIRMDWPSESTPTYPLEFAVAAGHFAVAKTLISHMCQGATHSQLDELVDHVFKGQKLRTEFRQSVKFSESELTELVCIALTAGASPNRKCFGTYANSTSVAHLKQLVDSTTAGIIAWLDIGLLEHYLFGNITNRMDRESLTKDVLQYVFFDYQHHLPRGDPKLRTIVFDALRTAIAQQNEEAVKTILKAFSLLGYRLDSKEACTGDMGTPNYMHNSIAQAFDNTDWDLTASLMMAKNSMASSKKPPLGASLHLPQSIPYPHEKVISNEEYRAHNELASLRAKLADAIKKKNLVLAYHLLQHPECLSYFGNEFVELAVSLGQSDMAISIIQEMESHNEEGIDGLVPLLKDGQTAAVSAVLAGNPMWHSALEAANKHDNFSALESMVFQGSAVPFIPKRGVMLSTDAQQLYFRVIAYHAMTTDDLKLCKWLLQLGMDADEFHMLDENPLWVEKFPATHCSFPGGSGSQPFGSDYVVHTLPSLLAIAAKQNHMGWMKFLLAEGVSAVDSPALLQAVKSKAAVATIRFLLGAAGTGKSSAKQTYGIAALREAIRSRDSTIINLLCEAVDIDVIEPSTEECLERKTPISALGEAIIMNDLEIVKVLLEYNADTNAYVSFDGLKMLEYIKSHLQRVTPLLAAIDMQSLPIVKLLVEHGAEINYTRNMGILRTPLQRAAEIGCFDIVQYLIQRGAIVDTNPGYSGGTALQLASMNGFCGITTFLLERGADPNYPPAKGDGRTAFEAAAEWSHIDTMSLLMQWNVGLDLEVGGPPKSQYERARRFAEKNGFPASKRFVEHLYRQTLGDQNWGDRLALEFM